MASPEQFRPGEYVRKFITDCNVTPFCGVITHIVPATNKIWVQWPIEHSQESPENLIKVNTFCFGLPTGVTDRGYDSYEKALSEKLYGRIPKEIRETDKVALRVAHTFATEVVGKLVTDIVTCKNQSLSDVQAYNRIYAKYANICSDYIMKSSIKKVYAHLEQEKTAADLKHKAIKLILDAQNFYNRVPDMKEVIAKLEKVLAKAFNITDKELVDAGFPKDVELFTRS
jgi:hypothetical protein